MSYTILYHIIPYCTILCRIVPYCTILYHTIPYYTIILVIVQFYTYHYDIMPIMFPISVSMVTRGHRILPCFDHGACCILLWIWPHNGNQYYIDNYIIQPETMFQNSFRVDFITSTLGWLKSPSANIVLGSLWNSCFLTTPEIIVKSEEQQHSWSGTPSVYCFNQYRCEAKLRIKLWK